ncbi:MAG: hypothetical protein RIT81_05220 [Deltaproteobacteria bacterium]
MRSATTAVVLPLLLLASTARAQEDDDGGSGIAPSLPPIEDEPSDPALDEIYDRLDEIEERLNGPDPSTYAIRGIEVDLNGYVDFGFFVPIGNDGVGWVQDFGNAAFPEYQGQYGWVFLGDILATTVNSRGEAADLGDAPGANRFDSINSRGAPGFAVNEFNLRLQAELGADVVLRTSVNFVPRTGNEFALGDFVEVDLAEMEWILTEDGGTSIFVGKSLPTFGIEYKIRKSDQRRGVTPSLVHRYTSGSQLGLKIRSKLLDDWVVLAASVTNNSMTTEQFHFYDEIDSNIGKTLNGRAAVRIPIDRFISAATGHTLEIGASGTFGAQDRALDSEDNMWFVGVDFEYRATSFGVRGQWIRGGAPGNPEDGVWMLDLNDSGYVELDWLVLPFLGIHVRGGMRDAFVALGTERAYLTKNYRVTAGAQFVFTPQITLKTEYLYNGEFGGVASFTNDIFTSSLLLKF